MDIEEEDSCGYVFPEEDLGVQFIAYCREDIDVEFIDDICDATLDIFAVSHLFNFDPARLRKHYQKSLRELVSTMLEHETTAEVKCEIRLVNNYGSTEFDHQATSIEVHIDDLVTKYSSKPRSFFYKCLMVSRGQTNNKENKPQLPTLLCHSNHKNIKDTVHQALQTIFDCRITNFQFKQKDMQWLLAVIAEQNTNIDDICDDLTIIYSPLSNGTEKLEFTMSTTCIHSLWKSVRRDSLGVEVTTDREVNVLMSALYYHIKAISGMMLEKMTIIGLSTLHAIFTSNGKVKLKSREVAEVFLRYITMRLIQEDKYAVQLQSPSTSS